MVEVRQTDAYDNWFRKLRDRRAKARILIRIHRLSLGNPGDVRPVGGGVSELRIDHGPGYRVYFHPVDRETVVLLVGGDKRTQRQDIERARGLAQELVKGEIDERFREPRRCRKGEDAPLGCGGLSR